MNKLLLFLLPWLAVVPAAFSMAAALNLDSALQEADLIARVKIVAVTDAPADSGFKHLARATITDAAKGPRPGESIELLSDNGFICPNVVYHVGDDCIVFAKRRKSGHFETMNTYAGQFLVENGVTEFGPFNREAIRGGTPAQIQAEVRRKTKAVEVMLELRNRLSKKIP